MRNWYTIIFLFFSVQWCAAQTGHAVLHPSYHDYIRHTQFLPGGGMRVLGASDQYHDNYLIERELIFADIAPGQDMDSVIVRRLDSFSLLATDYAYHLLREHIGNSIVSLPFADGSTLIAVDGFNCDYGYAGGMCWLSPDGEVEWQYSFYHSDSLYDFYPGEMLFLSEDIIALCSNEDTLLINRAGDILTQEIPPVLYTLTHQISTGYVTSRDAQLFVLDTAFQLRRAYNLDSPINNLSPIGDDRFFIATDQHVYLLLDTNHLEQLPAFMNTYDQVWWADATYWGIDINTKKVQQWDDSFDSLSISLLPTGVWSQTAGYHQGTSFVNALYAVANTNGILVYKATGPSIDLQLPFDIGVTQVEIPDTVFRTPPPFYLGNWFYEFGRLEVAVSNFGADTVFEFILVGNHFQHCGGCGIEKAEWFIDTLPLPPGATRHVMLPQYDSDCIYGNVTSLCLSTLSPNLKPDGDPLNNEFCQSFLPITVATHDLDKKSSLFIYPNPAGDQCWLTGDLDIPGELLVNFYSVHGSMEKSIRLASIQDPIDIHDLPQGMHMVQVTDRQGLIGMAKLIIQR